MAAMLPDLPSVLSLGLTRPSAASNTRDHSHSQDTPFSRLPFSACSFSFSLNSFSSCLLTPGSPCSMSELRAPSLQDFYLRALRTFCMLRALKSLAQAEAPLLSYRLTASVTATQHLHLAKHNSCFLLTLSPQPAAPSVFPGSVKGTAFFQWMDATPPIPSSSQVHAACQLPH